VLISSVLFQRGCLKWCSKQSACDSVGTFPMSALTRLELTSAQRFAVRPAVAKPCQQQPQPWLDHWSSPAFWQLVDGTSYENDDDEDQYGAVLWLSFQEGGGQGAGVEGVQGREALATGVPTRSPLRECPSSPLWECPRDRVHSHEMRNHSNNAQRPDQSNL
jgi:hypothetical protein